MTENEAIEIIQQQRENLHKVGNECQVPCENCKVNHCCFDYVAMGMAIQALEEIQPYRAIGTVEGYKRALEISKENFRVSMEYKAKVQEFESIGTIEEFKALKEKMQVIQIIFEDMKCQIGASGEHMDKKLSEWVDKLKG